MLALRLSMPRLSKLHIVLRYRILQLQWTMMTVVTSSDHNPIDFHVYVVFMDTINNLSINASRLTSTSSNWLNPIEFCCVLATCKLLLKQYDLWQFPICRILHLSNKLMKFLRKFKGILNQSIILYYLLVTNSVCLTLNFAKNSNFWKHSYFLWCFPEICMLLCLIYRCPTTRLVAFAVIWMQR